MSSKHVFNNPENLVLKSLRGAVILNPALRLHTPSKTVYLSPDVASQSKAQVLLVAGGGAGHEPASAAYTGIGMIRSAVSGDIFASPSAPQIRNAIDLALSVSGHSETEPKEVLLVVNNYTGDRLNFGLAGETIRSRGINVTTVTVADDVAVGRTPLGAVGRRGLAGYIFVSKALGAAAERSFPLKTVESLGNAIVENLASIGISLDHCHVPGKGKNAGDWDKLPEEACELGLGLHNERGAKRLDQTPEPREMVQMMLDLLLNPNDNERSFVRFSGTSEEETILFLNNLGGLSQLEMGAIVDEVFVRLEEQNISPCRVYCSSYMTSLNAPGFSISLLNVTAAHTHWEKSLGSPVPVTIPELFDDPTTATAWLAADYWPSRSRNIANEIQEAEELIQGLRSQPDLEPSNEDDSIILVNAIKSACEAVFSVEDELTRYDTVCGDGDCGATFAAGAKGILKSLRTPDLPLHNPASAALAIAKICENNMGGTSGALFAIFFTSLSSALNELPWNEACYKALEGLARYTPARPGDRTLVDSLHPFCLGLKEGRSFSEAVHLAKHGAENTKTMRPKLGRAVYVGQDDLSYEVPDPGAWGVYVIVDALSGVLNS
ncbi:hypothetical protein M422DRAFT_58449 [Sphaerobolus stellatus SS14]|nr:hypothetical protein M422DRAFT_58449 [Sphaerobolus stellatus SS14]